MLKRKFENKSKLNELGSARKTLQNFSNSFRNMVENGFCDKTYGKNAFLCVSLVKILWIFHN